MGSRGWRLCAVAMCVISPLWRREERDAKSEVPSREEQGAGLSLMAGCRTPRRTPQSCGEAIRASPGRRHTRRPWWVGSCLH
jgi:hypothetical protein